MDDANKTQAQLLQELEDLRDQVALLESDRMEPAPLKPATPEADAFASAVLETTDALIVVLDTLGRVLRFNRACERLTGYAFAEVRGKCVWELLLMAEEIEPVKAVFGNLQAGHFPNRFENIWVTKTGQHRHIMWSNTAMLDHEGDVAYIIGTGIDVTTERLTELARGESEERFRSIVEASIQGIYIHQEGVIQFANPAMASMFGYDSANALVGQPYEVTIAPHDRERLEGYRISRLQGEEAPSQYEYQAVRADGSPMWLACLASHLSWEGKPAVLAAFVDISARKQAEDDLSQQTALFEAVFSAVPDPLTITDPERRIVMSNPAVTRVLGYTSGELRDQSAAVLYESEAEFNRQGQLRFHLGAPEQFDPYEITYRRKSGEAFPGETVGTVIRSSDGEPLGYLGLIRDISDRKQAEDALDARSREQVAIAELGRGALAKVDIGQLMDDAVGMIAKTIRVDYCKILECLPDGNALRLRSGVGWQEGLVGVATVGAEMDSQTGYTLSTDEPVIVEDLRTDTRFSGPPLLHQHHVISGISVVIAGQDQPFGVLGAYTTAYCLFSPDDIAFIQAIANILAEAIMRQQAEAALQESQRALTTLMSNLPGMAYRSLNDRQWTLQFASGGCEALTGYYASDLIENKTISYAQLIHPDDREGVWNAVQHAVGQQAPFQVVYRIITATGQEKWVWEQGRSTTSTEGRDTFIEGFVIDISAKRQAEEALQRAHDELEQRVRDRTADLEVANEEIRRFAYIVSHDLRAPLINLKGFANELRDACHLIKSVVLTDISHLDAQQQAEVTRALEEDVPEALSFIDLSVSRMDGLIQSVLNLSRAGNRELHIEPVNTQELVQTLLQTLSHQLMERRVQVDIGALPEVQADPTAIEQIFGNLLSNAVKYLEADRPGKIAVTAEPHDEGTTFRVQDNGRGIAEGDIPKVMELFRRVGRQDTSGEGMGLAYVQTLVRRHGGDLRCQSELGVSTTFSFTLLTIIPTENQSEVS